ncbi:restriction endonuclease subunit S [Glycomyces sp. NRRL B-16210]|uniref:restriction endonuclease subunit S n=1 Tax=Glycomyces sp. NRRL B-16210 TaxID=1463821 RepID=UPI000B277533|nr:restriction endonuclease subunit S [Glycomyces sp. NRRL B-16210]
MFKRLRFLAEVNPPSPAFDAVDSNSEVAFLPMENIWPGSRFDTSARKPKNQVAVGYTRFQEGDILLPKITPTFEASRSVIATGLLGGVGTGTTELHILRPGSLIDARFLLYSISTHDFLNLGKAEMFGVAGQQRVPDDFVRDFPIRCLELDEQRRIADFLDTETIRIDSMVKAQEQLLTALFERRAAGVTHAVAGQEFIDRKESSLMWLQTIPSHWNEIRLGLVSRMGSGHTPSRTHPEWWQDCTIPWITTGEVKQLRNDRIEELHETRECISEVGLANSAAEIHPKGTVFLSRTASAGYSGIMGRDMATSQDFVTWTCEFPLLPAYLLWCLRAMRQDLLGRLAMGSTHKTIYVPDLQMLRIPFPSRSEQKQIVESIRSTNADIDSAVDAIQRQRELLAERRQALITAAVTGQFDVSSASGRGCNGGS